MTEPDPRFLRAAEPAAPDPLAVEFAEKLLASFKDGSRRVRVAAVILVDVSGDIEHLTIGTENSSLLLVGAIERVKAHVMNLIYGQHREDEG